MTDAVPSRSEDGIVAQAGAKVGIRDFGDESFREPLRRLLSSLRDELRCSMRGWSTAWRRGCLRRM